MIAVAILVALLVFVGGWLVVQLATGGWRRLVVRLLWARVCRSVGAAVRRDRVTRHKLGPGEKTSPLQQVEHVPMLWGLWGRPVGRLRDGRVGASWRVWAAVGQTTTELSAMSERMAATTWCKRCVFEPGSLRSARMTLLWKDPFEKSRRWHAPKYGALRPGFDVHSQAVEVPIIDSWGGGWLIGAASGSGKSAWLNAIVADLVRQPAGTVHMLGVDLKRVELGPWQPAFARVARTAPDADLLFAWCRQFIDQRMTDLEAAGKRHVPNLPTVEWPYVALVIDELGALLSGKGSEIDQRRAVLGELAMLGRAAGLLIVAAVQRPTTELVPGQLRDNLGRRVLLRVATLDQAQAVLGWRPTQAEIDQLDTPGLALVDLPGRQPFLARSTFGETDAVTALAQQHARPVARQEVAA